MKNNLFAACEISLPLVLASCLVCTAADEPAASAPPQPVPVTMRQDLWNAELRGTIQTDLGKLEFRALTQRDEMIHLIDVTSTEANADGSQAPWKWEFLPGNPDSPCYQLWPERSPNYERNPLPVLKEIDGIPVVEPRLLAGGDYATAWKEVAVDGRKARLFLTTGSTSGIRMGSMISAATA